MTENQFKAYRERFKESHAWMDPAGNQYWAYVSSIGRVIVTMKYAVRTQHHTVWDLALELCWRDGQVVVQDPKDAKPLEDGWAAVERLERFMNRSFIDDIDLLLQ